RLHGDNPIIHKAHEDFSIVWNLHFLDNLRQRLPFKFRDDHIFSLFNNKKIRDQNNKKNKKPRVGSDNFFKKNKLTHMLPSNYPNVSLEIAALAAMPNMWQAT
ncbi:hypothetical protein ACJX0J_039218, partial [Zea mays]